MDKDKLMQFAEWFFVAITEGENGLKEYDLEDMESEDYETVRYFVTKWLKEQNT